MASTSSTTREDGSTTRPLIEVSDLSRTFTVRRRAGRLAPYDGGGARRA